VSQVVPADASTLAYAVIGQAMRDISTVRWRQSAGGAPMVPTSPDAAEAISFLTDTVGAWAEARTLWCELGDLCPEAVRKAALGVLDASLVIPAIPHRVLSCNRQEIAA
jgi:hypothetical protein